MSHSNLYNRLRQPIRVKNVEFRNRIIKTPQQMNMPDFDDGSITDEVVAFYVALARGQMGALVVEQSPIEPQGHRDGSISVFDDAMLLGLTRLADAVHEQGCPIIVQINHLGPFAQFPPLPAHRDFQPLAPSALDRETSDLVFPQAPDRTLHALTGEEIKRIVGNFASAAERVKKAGFDGVELHGDHMYLINSFLSRVWNRRNDEYGCASLENRARFAVEVLEACRESVGKDYLLGVKLNGAEYGHPRGTTSDESKEFARMLEAGSADYFTIVADGYGAYGRMAIPDQVFYPEPPAVTAPGLEGLTWRSGMCVRVAGAVKGAVSVPVFAAGGMDATLGEKLLKQGLADGIAIGRVALADHKYPEKVFGRREDEVRPCIHCITCESRMVEYEPVRCSVNAALGRGFDGDVFSPADKPKSVAVVGGGPAGMEVARVMALRGHKVTVFEKESYLGGSVNLAALVKGTEVYRLPDFVDYLARQLARQGVTVKLGEEFGLATAQSMRPDAVVLATGGVPTAPDIPGITQKMVINTLELKQRASSALRLIGTRNVERLSMRWLPVGKRVVIIGGGIQGCEIAEFLVKRGRRVTVVEEGGVLGSGIPLLQWALLEPWLIERGATILANTRCAEISERGVSIVDAEGQGYVLEVDSVFVATPLRSNSALYERLAGKIPEVYKIGDCDQPGLIIDAVAAGFELARVI